MRSEKIKAVTAVLSGIGAFVFSVLASSGYLFEERVRKKGRGNRAIFISGKSDSGKWIYPCAASVLLAVAGLFSAMLYYDGKE